MSLATVSLVFDSTTDARFRSWGSGIAALFLTGGFWTQTADTGQINWSTVVSPAQNAFAGYEIYKSNDALSSSFPIYMKVEYGCSNSVTKGSLIRFSFATGTDGAGTLNGNVSSTYVAGGATAGTGATTYPFFVSGGAGYFAMFLWNAASGAPSSAIVIERSLDSSGAYTNAYATWIVSGMPAVKQRSILKPSTGTFATELSGDVFTLYSASASMAMGTFAAVFPVFPFLGFADNPMTAIMGMKSGDITEGAGFDVIMYGTSHHYLWSNRTGVNLGATVTLGIGIRYE